MLSEDEKIEKHGKNCGHCNRNMLLPYEYERNCFSCGFNVHKRKNELSKIQREKNNFINRLKYAEQKMFCLCMEVYQIYEGNDYKKIFQVLSKLKNIKLKINNILIEKYKSFLESSEFEQNYW